MRRWAFVVIIVYAVIILGISMALAMLAVEDVPFPLAVIYSVLWVAVMVVCQAGLLVVPVRLQSRRPVTKRHLFWPILVAMFSCLALAAGIALAAWETLCHIPTEEGWDMGEPLVWASFIIGGVWIAWAFVFGFYTGGREPATFMRRAVRFLIAGSILELLVAVPAHIIARSKDYCCAGWMTVWGLGLGVSVALFAFGPGAFTLLVRRWQSVRNQQPGRTSEV